MSGGNFANGATLLIYIWGDSSYLWDDFVRGDFARSGTLAGNRGVGVRGDFADGATLVGGELNRAHGR